MQKFQKSRQTNQTHWYDAYRYIGRDLNVLWDKHGGQICTIAGTVGMTLTGIHACRKTYKIHDKLKKNGEAIYLAGEEDKSGSRLRKAKNKTKAFISCSAKTAKDYLPDIVGGVASGLVIRKGWAKEHELYKGAAAAFGVLAADFMTYRENVIAEHGKDADRRYLTTKRADQKALDNGTNKSAETGNGGENDDGFVVDIDQNMLRIWYSKETTPRVWSESHLIRMSHLNRITSTLECMLKYGGHYSVNDVRREFYGVKGDVAAGGMFGRVWDPGNPAHPERGACVNLHYEDDQDFVDGRTDSCWIIIDIDDEPLIETLKAKSIGDIMGVERD